MKTTADHKETQKLINQYYKLSKKSLKSLLKIIENDPLKKRLDKNKIDAIKTLLM